MRIIDAHAHVFEGFSGFGGKGELRPLGQGRGRWATGEEIQVIPEEYGDVGFSPENLMTLMDQNSVSQAVLLQGSLYGFQNPEQTLPYGCMDPGSMLYFDCVYPVVATHIR